MSNLDDLADTLTQATHITSDLARLVAGAGAMLEAEGKKRCPVDTGALRASISHDSALTGDGTGEATAGPELFYGKFVEFGTRRQTPQPFMQPAGETVLDWTVQQVNRLADKAVDS